MTEEDSRMTDGRKQAEAYAKLAKPWRPSEIGGIKIGDAVRLPNLECTFEVVAISDPLVTLRAPSGREVRAGWRAVTRVSPEGRR
jgi:hypothetical protein